MSQPTDLPARLREIAAYTYPPMLRETRETLKVAADELDRLRAQVAESEARPAPGVTIKGGRAWKEWLDAGAAHCRMAASTLVDLAVADYLERRGFERRRPRGCHD